MGLFGIFRRGSSAKRVSTVRNQRGGGNYRIVTSESDLREKGVREQCDESDILDFTKRSKVLDMVRNQVRNSPTFNAILKQFDLNAIGTVGGKATFVMDSEDDSRALRESFAKWARSAEYFDGMRLGDMLKVVLKTYLVGGECVLVFDDRLVEDSGRVMVFEPDELANVSEKDWNAHMPEGWRQVHGHIRNQFDREVGVIVSRSGRGEREVSWDKAWKLAKDANSSDTECLWINPKNVWRKGQAIGTSPATASVSTVMDLEDFCTYENQSAKKNAQTLAQVFQSSQPDVPVPSAFESGTDFAGMTDQQIECAAADEGAAAEETRTLSRLTGAGCIYEVMPDGSKVEMLDTKHPNPNVPEYIDFLTGRACAPMGLTKMYATMKVDQSFSGCQGEMNMSWPAFEEVQKFLEQICDWILARWTVWAGRRGELPVALDGPIGRRVTWQWPRMRAVNAVDEQNAQALRLRNCTGSFADIYGADWREKLLHIGEEIAFCRENGIPHPATITTSGAVIQSMEDGE